MAANAVLWEIDKCAYGIILRNCNRSWVLSNVWSAITHISPQDVPLLLCILVFIFKKLILQKRTTESITFMPFSSNFAHYHSEAIIPLVQANLFISLPPCHLFGSWSNLPSETDILVKTAGGSKLWPGKRSTFYA